MAEFFEMSGYGLYIWSAYFATFLLLVVVWLFSKKFAKNSEAKLTKLTTKDDVGAGKTRNEAQI